MPDLVEKWQHGDVTAFETLYRQYEKLVFRTAYLITGSKVEAEDALQEVFVSVKASSPPGYTASPSTSAQKRSLGKRPPPYRWKKRGLTCREKSINPSQRTYWLTKWNTTSCSGRWMP